MAEKTNGAIPPSDVAAISIERIRRDGPNGVRDFLVGLKKGQVCVVNAASYRDLETATLGILHAEAAGKRFLFRSAASLVRTYAGLQARPLLTVDDFARSSLHGGLIVVGSYVARSSQQLEELLALGNVQAITLRVEKLLSDADQDAEIARVQAEMNRLLDEQHDVVIYTSRNLITGDDAASSLVIGNRVSESLVRVVQGLNAAPRYIIAKGGITSSDVATRGLDVKRAMVRGQILPGVPVWQMGEETRFPGIPYVVFPGNVGGPDALAEATATFNAVESVR